MSITSEISRIQNAKAAIKTSIVNKGVSVEDSATIDQYASKIDAITAGDGEETFTGHVDAVGLAQIGWTEDDIAYLQEDVWWNEEDDDDWKVTDEDISLYNQYIDTGIYNASTYYKYVTNTFGVCKFFPKLNFQLAQYRYFDQCKAYAIPQLTFSTNFNSLACYFYNCSNLRSINTTNLVTSKIINCSAIFQYCVNLKRIDTTTWDTSNLTDLSYAFYSCESLKDFSFIENINTEKVTNFSYCFYQCLRLKEIDLSCWDFSKATDFRCMFYICQNLKNVNFGNTPITTVTRFAQMFDFCRSLEEIDLSMFDFSNGESNSNNAYRYMFDECNTLRKVIFPTNMTICSNAILDYMFASCYCLEKIDFDSWNITDTIKSMDRLLNWCLTIKDVNFSGVDFNKITKMGSAFNYCSPINYDLSNTKVSSSWTSDASNYLQYNQFSVKSLIGGKKDTTLKVLEGNNVSTALTSANFLDRESIVCFMNGLADRTGQTSLTLRLGNENLAKLTEDDKLIALNKNWLLTT